MRVVLVLLALGTDLPNANLPGNSPSLPNANLPGSLPNDNPISLPNSDTTPSVWHYGADTFTPEGLPLRNPTLPPTPAEIEAAQAPQRAFEDQLNAARDDAAAAREDAARAREDAANAREEAQPPAE
jgi:hypothetical protein